MTVPTQMVIPFMIDPASDLEMAGVGVTPQRAMEHAAACSELIDALRESVRDTVAGRLVDIKRKAERMLRVTHASMGSKPTHEVYAIANAVQAAHEALERASSLLGNTRTGAARTTYINSVRYDWDENEQRYKAQE